LIVIPLIVLLFFYHTTSTVIYSLSLHDALPISPSVGATTRSSVRPSAQPPACTRTATGPRARGLPMAAAASGSPPTTPARQPTRSEEHTSELQSRENLVCRLLLEKKKQNKRTGE